MAWYNNPITIPYGAGDPQLGGNHLVDIGTPFGTQIQSIVSGTITNYEYTPWGGQITMKLDNPINGVPYAFYIHLDSLNPNIGVGQHINVGDLIGISGGQNSGGTHPETTFYSTQPQTGFGLSHGPVFGSGDGWVQFPLQHPELNPTAFLNSIRAGQSPLFGGTSGFMTSNLTSVVSQAAQPGTQFFSQLGQKLGLILFALVLIVVGFTLVFSKQLDGYFNKSKEVAA